MFDEVHFTGTINLGAISGALLTLLGLYIVYVRGKLAEQKTRKLFQEEMKKTRECVHALPYHPENKAFKVRPDVEPGQPGIIPGRNFDRRNIEGTQQATGAGAPPAPADRPPAPADRPPGNTSTGLTAPEQPAEGPYD